MKMCVLFLAFSVLFTFFAVFPSMANANYIVLQPIADSMVSENLTRTNYGEAMNIYVGYVDGKSRYVYFMYNLSVPFNSRIDRANFTLYKTGGNGTFPHNYSLHTVNMNYWNETTIFWQTQPCDTAFNNRVFCETEPEHVSSIIEYPSTRYGWNVTDAVKNAYYDGKQKISFLLKDNITSFQNWTAFASRENVYSDRKPYLRIDYTSLSFIELNYPSDKEYINKGSISFNCSTTGHVVVNNVTIYSDLYGIWGPIETKYSGTQNASFVFNITPSENGFFTWNCLAFDVNNNSAWGVNHTFRVDRTDDVPELKRIGAYTDVYTNLTFYSEWWGHLNPVSNGVIEEDSNGFFQNHTLIPENGVLFYVLQSDSFKRNQAINYRFYAQNNYGLNVSGWKNITIPDYWEPRDKYFQSFKKTVDYIKNYQYNPYVDVSKIPVIHDDDPYNTYIRKVQAHVMDSALQTYLLTNDRTYIDMANDIARWVLLYQSPEGYYRDDPGTGTDPVDNIYASSAVAQRMLHLSSITGNVTQQISAERVLLYHINNTWNNVSGYFYDYPGSSTNVKINFNAHAAAAYGYACYIKERSNYCYYANKTLYWVASKQFINGSWPYRAYDINSQSDAYTVGTLEGFAEGVYWLRKSGFYSSVPPTLNESIRKGVEYVKNQTNEDSYFYSGDDSSAGLSHSMMYFSVLFSKLGFLNKNSTTARWTWKQLDYMIDTAPGGQNENGSWNGGNIVYTVGNVNSFQTAYVAGFFSEVINFQSKPWNFVEISENVCWLANEPHRTVDITLLKNDGFLVFEKSINVLNVNGTPIYYWGWNITEPYNFSIAYLNASDNYGPLRMKFLQDGSLYRMSASRFGLWTENDAKTLTYTIVTKDLGAVQRLDTPNAIAFSFRNYFGNFTAKNFRVLLPNNFRPNGEIRYVYFDHESWKFMNNSNATIYRDGKYTIVNFNYFVPFPVGRYVLVIEGTSRENVEESIIEN